MRIAVVADSHFDEHSRFDECRRVHDWIAVDAAQRGCRAWLHAGDVFERKSTPAERLAVADWVSHMRAGIGPGVIVRGNHDAAGDLPLLERLDGRPVQVVESARVVAVDVGGEELAVACLAWPERGRLTAISGSKEETESTAKNALSAVLREFGDNLDSLPPGVARMFLAHAMVRGSRVSTGQPLIGCDFEVGLEDLALAHADFYALGHIHMGQEWSIAGAPAAYPASPRRTSFGELEPKGYLVVEFAGGRLVKWERVETPCAPMYHFDAEWCDGAMRHMPYDLWPHLVGAEVRLRYKTPADQREAAKARALALRDDLVGCGAVMVKVEEEVITKTRTKTPGVALAERLTDKLDAFWQAKNIDIDARRHTLHAKASDLENELRALDA